MRGLFQWTYPYRYGDQGNPRRNTGSGKQGIPSVEAVAMAKEYHLTLICAARRDRMKLFTGNNPTE